MRKALAQIALTSLLAVAMAIFVVWCAAWMTATPPSPKPSPTTPPSPSTSAAEYKAGMGGEIRIQPSVVVTCTIKITVTAFALKQHNSGPGKGSVVFGSDMAESQKIQTVPPICRCSDKIVRECQ